MPYMKYWDGVQWVTLDAADADTLNGKTALDFAPATHVGSGGTAHALATTTSHGFLSKEDKQKLENLSTLGQNVFSHLKIGANTISADTPGDTLEFIAGSGIKLEADVTNDKLTLSVDTNGLPIATLNANGRVADSERLQGYTITDLDARYAAANHLHPLATQLQAGFMSAADKTALDTLVAGGTTEPPPEGGTTTETTKFVVIESFVTPTDGQTNIPIGIVDYSTATDLLEVYYNNLRLDKDRQWQLNANGTSIDLLGFTAKAVDGITFVVTKRIITSAIYAPSLMGSNRFNGTTGTIINHSLGHTGYHVWIVPTENAVGYLGEWWVEKGANSFKVCNTGTATTAFDYAIIVL